MPRTRWNLLLPAADRLKPRFQRGTSTVEVIVALAVLATAVVGVGRFAATTNRGLRERQLSSRIGWELTNAREQIGAWDPESVTPSRIESLPFSSGLTDELHDLQWQAEVAPLSAPAQALQVSLTLQCTFQGQTARPASLVFWLPSSPPEPSAPEVATP